MHIEVGIAIEIAIGAIGESFDGDPDPTPISISISVSTALARDAQQELDASPQSLPLKDLESVPTL